VRPALAARLARGCARSAQAPEAGLPASPRPTQVGRYLVELRFEPDPPPLGELFRVEARVTVPDGRPVETAKVEVDARMPQHEHGMETRPRLRPGACDDAGQACRHEDGRYVFDGFKFHMPGDWTVVVQVEGPRGPDSTSIVYRAR